MDHDVERLATDLHSAAIHLLRKVREVDSELGITPARLSALSVVALGGPRTVSELAKAEQVAGPTMSRIVAALEAAGLAVRRPHPQDGRAMVVHATEKGRSVMERGRARRVGVLAARLERLPDDDRRTLEQAVRLLRSLVTRNDDSS
ncbi:MarR family transcriptional regulator [Acrocarpospora macrocephala]|uniref:MarR family transcriptional regulator n=1 Tax=Acrocarpospora macrocephala TaxID=150177 RepID=A0A5M3WS79_9ACTN|nr:MarR family transcriptional regulator [Acrocarpospora macrocephala]GES09038.1 MarR family transcriptional regulator [Acrocarpospora macrocephala]